MALYWDWKSDKIGEVEMANGTILNLYSGNALVICVLEDEGYYTMSWFWSDEAHMKNMLGLTKGYDNCMAHWGITRIALSLAYKKTPAIVQALAKAKMEVLIDLYTPVQTGSVGLHPNTTKETKHEGFQCSQFSKCLQ